jgi:outer membrane immunogenic protein
VDISLNWKISSLARLGSEARRLRAIIAFPGAARNIRLDAIAGEFLEGLVSNLLRKTFLAGGLTASIISLSDKPAAAQGFPAAASGANAASASSWVAGAHAGYNWQQGSMLYGFETDFQGTNLNSSMAGKLINTAPGDFATTKGSIDYYGTFRGRLGVTTGQWLFYGTAGAAYANVDLTSSFSASGLQTSTQTSEPKIGWVAGVGAEYLLRPNLTLNLGYQYLDLGRTSISSSTVGFNGALTVGQVASIHSQFQTVTLGLSWRFAPAGSGSPWAGGYAGGQAGGAWGNSANALYTSIVDSTRFSDIRLKRDVTLLTRRGDGLGIYRYRYLWSDAVYVGVMAQEVALIYPDAVVRDPLFGYLSVNYGRLGLQPLILFGRRDTLTL